MSDTNVSHFRGSALRRPEHIERAALLYTHPLRAWAVERAITAGQVTVPELLREWTAFTETRMAMHLKFLVNSAWLAYAPGQYRFTPTAAYVPDDISGLVALQDHLTRLLALAPTPEVPQ